MVNAKRSIGLLLLLLVGSCSAEYLPVALTPDGEDVTLSSEDPPAGCEEIGPVQASHGTQCNVMNRTGTQAGAYTVLRNSAGSRGANFVRIERDVPPQVELDNCLYGVRGVAYRCP